MEAVLECLMRGLFQNQSKRLSCSIKKREGIFGWIKIRDSEQIKGLMNIIFSNYCSYIDIHYRSKLSRLLKIQLR